MLNNLSTLVNVELAIFGEKFNPEELTKELNLKPIITYKKGDFIKGNPLFIRQETSWSIETGYEESLNAEEVVKKLISIVELKKNEIIALKSKHNLECKLYIVVNIEDNDVPSLHLDQPTIGFINSIGAEIEVCLYLV